MTLLATCAIMALVICIIITVAGIVCNEEYMVVPGFIGFAISMIIVVLLSAITGNRIEELQRFEFCKTRTHVAIVCADGTKEFFNDHSVWNNISNDSKVYVITEKNHYGTTLKKYIKVKIVIKE